MPTIRKKSPQRRANYDRLPKAYEWHFLHGENPAENQDIEGCFDCFVDMRSPRMREIWEGARDRLFSEWLKEHPGTRPHGWWMYDSPRDPETMQGTAWAGTLPIPRERIGGKGVTMSEKYPGIIPRCERGIPASWYEIDEEDPPVYESEAAYLERHGLLLPGEQRRLKPKDYEPERVTSEE